MSSTNATNDCIALTFACINVIYSAHHTWRFDKWRCLAPRRKEWFRVLLTWMLIGSNVGMFIWASGWTYAKYKLGWTVVPGRGPMPVPSQLWTEHYTRYNPPLTFFLVLSYCLNISLNAEEALYWYHLIRAVRHANSASQSWLSSRFFGLWITVSGVATFIQFAVTWIHYGTFDSQMGRAFTCAGAIQLILVGASSWIILQFPSFLTSVKTSGAGPEVRTRLHIYHELNKVRTLARFIFAVGTLTLGSDALTEAKRINSNRVAPDVLEQIIFGSYFFSNVLGIMLYLPRSYASTDKPIAGQVFVGRGAPPAGGAGGAGGAGAQYGRGAVDTQASINLKTLLREGGQWDDIDDARAQALRTQSGQWGLEGGGRDFDDVDAERDREVEREREYPGPSGYGKEDAEEQRQGYGSGNGFAYGYGSGSGSGGEKWAARDGDHERLDVPELGKFTSPFDVQLNQASIPRELKIHVEHEVEVVNPPLPPHMTQE